MSTVCNLCTTAVYLFRLHYIFVVILLLQVAMDSDIFHRCPNDSHAFLYMSLDFLGNCKNIHTFSIDSDDCVLSVIIHFQQFKVV